MWGWSEGFVKGISQKRQLSLKPTSLKGGIMSIQKGKKETCCWTEECDYSDYYWSTECGEDFTCLEGTPRENKMKYCPFCGKRIWEVSIDEVGNLYPDTTVSNEDEEENYDPRASQDIP